MRTAIRLCLIACLATAISIPDVAAADRVGYKTRHYDLQSLDWRELSFTGWHYLRLPPRPPVDKHGIPMLRKGGTRSYAVGELAMNGMRRLVKWRVRGTQKQFDQALKQARKLRKLAITRRDAWFIPHGFDYPPGLQRAPWYNAMTQGLALSFFVRLHALTGDAVHMDAARKVFRSFLQLGPGRRPWVAYVDDAGYLWLEHYPSRQESHVLNAHMHAVFGLYEFWQATGSERARRVLEGAIRTIEDHLPRYRRRGGVSLYDLYFRSVILKYHKIHIWQLRLLGKITNKPYFGRMAKRFREDRKVGKTWRGTPGYPPIPERWRADGPALPPPAAPEVPGGEAAAAGDDGHASTPIRCLVPFVPSGIHHAH